MARDDGARLGPDDARGAPARGPHGAGRTHDVGRTTTADHHNLFPPASSARSTSRSRRRKTLGMRMTVTRGSMGVSEKDGGLQPDSIVQDFDAILEDSERVAEALPRPSPGAMIRVALAPCSPLAVPQRVMTELAELAERYDAGLHCHLCQSPEEDAYAVAAFGKRSVDLLEEAGWFVQEPGSRTASISPTTKSFVSGRPVSASPIAPPPTWPSGSEFARRKIWRRPTSQLDSAWTARPPTIPPT